MLIKPSFDDRVHIMKCTEGNLKEISDVLKNLGESSQKKQLANDFTIKKNRLFKKNVGGNLLFKPIYYDVVHSAIEGTEKRLFKHFWFLWAKNFVKNSSHVLNVAFEKIKEEKSERIFQEFLSEQCIWIIWAPLWKPWREIYICWSTRYVVLCSVKMTKRTLTLRATGPAKRVNKSDLSYLKSRVNDTKHWNTEIRNLQWTLNINANGTTKYTPIDLMFDFLIRDVLGNKVLVAIQDHDHSVMNIKRSDVIKNIEGTRKIRKVKFNSIYTTPPHKYRENDFKTFSQPARFVTKFF